MLTIDNATIEQRGRGELPYRVFLALGGNLGDRRANLQEALQRLRAGGRLRLTRLSSLYETEPFGYSDQPEFLNMVAEAQTDFTPLELLDYVKQIEAGMGRQLNFRNGPRPIDLDLLFFDNTVFETERLQLPHPRMRGRGFVFAPLAELASDLVHPELGLTVAELAREIDMQAAGVKRYTAESPLELPAPRFLFVTGRLAESWLLEYLTDLGNRLGFEYQIAQLPMDVAAFMSVRFISDKLKLGEEEREKLDLIIVPGWARGELEQLEQAAGVKAVRGPTELAQLEPFLQKLVAKEKGEANPANFCPSPLTETQLRAMQARLTDGNIRIYTDGERIYAFNNEIFAVGGTDEKELRGIFRQLKIDNASHAYYIGKELTKAAHAIKLNLPYHQDRELL